MTILDLITDALTELNIYQAGEALRAEDGALGLSRLNRILDKWNADGRRLYNESFVTNTLTPNLQPHTIGPTGTWSATTRPVDIVGANLVLNTTTPNVKVPITIRDDNWWLMNSVPALATSYPTDLYYSPDFPNGSLYFWPVPTTAYPVDLLLHNLFAQVVLSDTVSLPPGYLDAVTLTLAEDLRKPFAAPPDPDLKQRASDARALVFANNENAPRLRTQDAGMPSDRQSSNITTFNYLNGTGR
jgi:hypothetical protein